MPIYPACSGEVQGNIYVQIALKIFCIAGKAFAVKDPQKNERLFNFLQPVWIRRILLKAEKIEKFGDGVFYLWNFVCFM